MDESPEIKSAKEILAASDAKPYLIAPSHVEFIVSQANTMAMIALAKEFNRFNNWLEDQSKRGGVLNK